MLVSYTHRVQFKSSKIKRNISDFLFLFKRFALQTVYATFKRFPVQIVQNMIKNIWNHFSYFERFSSQNVHYIMNRTIYTPKMFITSWTEQNKTVHCLQNVFHSDSTFIFIFTKQKPQLWISLRDCTGFQSSKQIFVLSIISVSFSFTSYSLRISYWICFWFCVYFWFMLLHFLIEWDYTYFV